MQWLSLVQFIKFGMLLALLPPVTSIETSASAGRRSLFAVQSAQQIS